MSGGTEGGFWADRRLLRVEDLYVSFRTGGESVAAVRGLTFAVGSEEIVGIAGESGSGKTVSALAIIGLLSKRTASVRGAALLNGRDLLSLSERDRRRVRGREIGLVYQDPLVALNPLRTIGSQLLEAVKAHSSASRAANKERVLELLAMVSLQQPRRVAHQYPHQLSGGMRQRVLIAIGIASRPTLLIADEPTTALDVSVQAHILDLLLKLQAQHRMSVILISHDLGLLAQTTDRLVVMYGGEVVEAGPSSSVTRSPEHPYTAGLLGARPSSTSTPRTRLAQIPGQPLDLNQMSHLAGCVFAPRCALATPHCREERPSLRLRSSNHFAACWETEGERVRAEHLTQLSGSPVRSASSHRYGDLDERVT